MKTKNNKPIGNGHNPTELVMQASLQLLPLIMNNIPQAVFWKDRDLVYLGCNQAFADDAGFSSPEEIVGKTDFEMPWRDQAELYRADDWQVMEKGEPKLNYEEPQTTPNGSTIWLSTSKIPVRENGQVVAVLGMYEDITARKQAEKDLLLRDRALASSLNAVVILNLQDSKPIYVNDAILKMTGYTREEVMQVGLSDITGNPAAPREIRAAIQAQGFFVGEELIKRKDGSVFPASFFSSLITDDKGQPIAVQSSFFDITGRKQAEEALHASEERFRRFTEVTVEGLVFHEQGKIMDANPAGLAMFGLSNNAEFNGRNLLEFIVPESHKLVLQQMQLETVLPYEIQCISNDGVIFPVETSTRTYKVGDRTIRASSIRNITERKQVEQNLKLQSAALESAANAIVITDRQGTIIWVNPAFTHTTGYTAEEVIGKNPRALKSGKHSEEFYREMWETILAGRVWSGEIINRRKDGSHYAEEMSITPVRNERGEITHFAAIKQDISERKRAEQTLQENQQLLQLVMDNIPQSVFWKDKNLTYLGVNQAFAEDAGFASPQEIVGRNDFDMPWKEQAELYRADDQRVLDLGETKLNYEEPQTGPTGQVTWLRTSKIPMRDANGQTFAVLGMYEDITERKQADQALRDSQQLLQAVMDNIPLSIFWKDAQLNYMGCNLAFAADVALASPNDVIGKSDFDMPSKDRAEHYRADDSLVINSGTPKLNFEEPQTTPDGSTNWLRTSKIPMRDADGKVFAMLGIYEDITEQKRLQEKVEELFERRGYQVQISTEISQEIAAAPELNELFGRVVTLTKERLGFYHTQLLRYDSAQDAVVLINGYGETGQKMLESGHKMPMGEGLIGTAAASGETVLRPNLAEDSDWHPNPLLPETRGEIAIPIKFGEQILGVLDVQSDQAGALTEDDRLLLEGLCGQVAVAIEQTRLRQEMAERLEEVNRLYRSMSQEGWKTYRETADLPTGFMFDQTGTKPVEHVALADESFTSVPMKVLGGEAVGSLAVANDPRRPMSQEDIDFLQQVSEQVALALEGARLAAQTQSALAQSEKLFEASRLLTQATDLQELISSTVDMLGVSEINRAILATFNYDAENNIESLDIAANWWNGTGHEATTIGTHYPLDVIRAMSFFVSPTPVFFDDTFTDERVDATTMKLVRNLNLRAVAVLPLHTGTRQIGALILEAEEPHNFTQDETRLFTALAPQISTVLENRRQFKHAQQQAERESTLNIISQKIQSATTVEAVLQIAARELGHALGAPMTIAQLSMKDKK